MQIIVNIIKKISYIIWVNIIKVDNRLNIVLESNRFCNFYIIIFRLNIINSIFLKDFLIYFFKCLWVNIYNSN